MEEKRFAFQRALLSAKGSLAIFGASVGDPTSFYLKRRKQGAEMWLRCRVSEGDSFNLNISIALDLYPPTFVEARKYMIENFGVREIKKHRVPAKLRIVK